MTSPMLVQFAYLVSVVIGVTALPYVNWKEVRRGKYLMTLYTAAMFSTIMFSSLSLLALATDCTESETCQAGMTIVRLIFDTSVTITVEFTMIKRMEILVSQGRKRFLYIFYVVPCFYPLCNIAYGLGLFGIHFSGQDDIMNTFNILVPINSLIVEYLLAYHLVHGDHTARFAPHKRRVRSILYQTIVLCVSMAGCAVYTAFVQDLGYALIYVLAGWAYHVIGSLNQLIIQTFRAEVNIVVEPSMPAAGSTTAQGHHSKGTRGTTSNLVQSSACHTVVESVKSTVATTKGDE